MKTDCDYLDEAGLRDHLLSRLPPAQEARVISHLDTCAICQQSLESFADCGSGLLETARRVGQQDVGERTAPQELLSDLMDTGECRPAVDELADYLDPATDPAHLGRIEHYAVLSIAGQGGMGIALKALDEKLGRVVCLKVLGRSMVGSPTARRRFLREARAAAAIRSDHVVTFMPSTSIAAGPIWRWSSLTAARWRKNCVDAGRCRPRRSCELAAR